MVYLLHFSEPYKHARHYIGAAPTLEIVLGTVDEPTRWSSSPLLHAAHAAGVRFRLAEIHEGTNADARRLRARKHSPSWCSVCRALARGGEAV